MKRLGSVLAVLAFSTMAWAASVQRNLAPSAVEPADMQRSSTYTVAGVRIDGRIGIGPGAPLVDLQIEKGYPSAMGPYIVLRDTNTSLASNFGPSILFDASTPGKHPWILNQRNDTGDFNLNNFVSPYQTFLTVRQQGDVEAIGSMNVGSAYKIAGTTLAYGSAALGSTYLGLGAGNTTASGSANTFVGKGAGTALTSGYYDTFVGYEAGIANATGFGNTFLGAVAGTSHSTGYNNTFIGQSAGGSENGTSDNVFAGVTSGANHSTGGGNTFIGTYAGNTQTNSSQSIFIGQSAGQSLDGDANNCIGAQAGQNASGAGNTYVGSYAGLNHTGGNSNVYLGNWAGAIGTGGYNNLYAGFQAGGAATGSQNVYLGFQSGYDDTGWGNVYLGDSAGRNNKGSLNVFLGGWAGQYETSASSTFYLGNYLNTLMYGVFTSSQVAIGATSFVESEKLSVPGAIYIGGVMDYGLKTAAEIQAMACALYSAAVKCRVQNSTDDDIYTSTGPAAGDWRNTRTGTGP